MLHHPKKRRDDSDVRDENIQNAYLVETHTFANLSCVSIIGCCLCTMFDSLDWCSVRSGMTENTIKDLAVPPPKTSTVCYLLKAAWFKHLNSRFCDVSVGFDVDFVPCLVRWNEVGYRVERSRKPGNRWQIPLTPAKIFHFPIQAFHGRTARTLTDLILLWF